MNRIKYSEIFVPGGFPRHTYNPRLSLQLEDQISQVKQNLCKLVTVTGHTKSGKTVLARKMLPREESVWVDGGTVGEENDFWETVLLQLDLFQTTGTELKDERAAEIQATGKGETGLIVAKGSFEVGGSVESKRGTSSSRSRTISSKVAALAGLREQRLPIIIDDFHYLPRELQGHLVRALKPLIFDGQPVVLMGYCQLLWTGKSQAAGCCLTPSMKTVPFTISGKSVEPFNARHFVDADSISL